MRKIKTFLSEACPTSVDEFRRRYGDPRMDMANDAAREYSPWRLDGAPMLDVDYLMLYANILKDQVLYVYGKDGQITHIAVVDPTRWRPGDFRPVQQVTHEGQTGKPNLRLVKCDDDRARFLLRKPIYQLRISLIDIEPEIWRRVLVSGNMSLGKLHDVIQTTMGWEDYHLHQFQLIDGRRFCRQDPEPDEGAGDERRTKLRKIAPDVGSAFSYHYDFGDDWIHKLVVEEIISPQESGRTPRCIDGQRACPPEDIGGPFGYERYLEAMMDRKHPEHREMREWRGAFDADEFYMDAINQKLRRDFRSG